MLPNIFSNFFEQKKVILNFLMPKWIFCEASMKTMMKNGITQMFTQNISYLMDN
jgi:hypothetical protein